MALTVGSRLGHYDVTALIGEGGMGQVCQATDTQLKRQVALKVLPVPPISLPQGLTVRQAADAWGVSKSTAARWINSGTVPA